MKPSSVLLIIAIAGSSCSWGGRPDVSASYRAAGVPPSKDELWTSEGMAFSASEFEALEERFPPLSPESRLRLSQYLSLHSILQKEGKIPAGVTVDRFAEDIRALLPPQPSGFDPEAFRKRVAETYGSDSVAAWQAELDRRLKSRSFEWNLTLLREYGLKP